MTTLAALISGIVSLISAAISYLSQQFQWNAGRDAQTSAQRKAELDDIATANDARLRQRIRDAHGVPDDEDPNRRD